MSVLELRNVSLHRGGTVALESVSLRAATPFTAVVGPNGAGKSSLIDVAAGFVRGYTGDVLLGGTPASELTALDRARLVGVMRQRSEAVAHYSVAEFVELGIPRATFRRASDIDDAVTRALSQTETLDLASRDIATLSGGQLQRALVAKAIVHSPRLLLLDEPVNHLDPAHRFSIMQLVSRLSVSAVAVLHDLELASRLAQHVVVLEGGRLVAQGAPQEVFSKALLREVFGVAGEFNGDQLSLAPLSGW